MNNQDQQLGGGRTDGEIRAAVDGLLAEGTYTYRALVGLTMSHFQGKVNPAQVVRIVKDTLTQALKSGSVGT